MWKGSSACASYGILHMAERFCVPVTEGSLSKITSILIRRFLRGGHEGKDRGTRGRLIAFYGASSGQ